MRPAREGRENDALLPRARVSRVASMRPAREGRENGRSAIADGANVGLLQ